MRNGSRLLIDEPPLQVIPSLAVAVGLNEAIVLQQFHYWIKGSKHERDDRYWVYNTVEEWQKQFPFWSVSTVKRTIGSLEKQGLIVTGNYNENTWDRTRWYAIDYDRLDELDLSTVNRSIGSKWTNGSVQPEPIHSASLPQSSFTETTHEITAQQQQDPALLLLVANVIEALEDWGVTPAAARRHGQRDPDLARRWLEWLASLPLAERPQQPAAYLVAKLRAGERPPQPRRSRGWTA